MDMHTIGVLLIVFLSTFTASTLGFGLGLIAMPLLALLVDIKTATPLIAIVGTVMSFFIFAKNWKEASLKNIWKLIIASLVGLPIGLFFLKGTGDSVMKIILALVIIIFAVYSLLGRHQVAMKAEWPSYGLGLMAGIFGAAYNIAGPPVIIYGALKKWPPSIFRATIFSFFFPSCVFIVSSHLLTGLVTQPVLYYSALSFPIVIFSTVVGGILNRRLPTERFNNIVYICLLLVGFSLIFKVLSDVI